MNNFRTAAVLTAFAALSLGAANAQANACGEERVQYKVSTAKSESLPAAPAADMGQIVFLQKLDGPINGKPITRFAVDGKWVGANEGNSYFAVSVPAGDHAICADRQTTAKSDRLVKVDKLVVSPGKTYYYEFKMSRVEVGSVRTSHAGSNGALAPSGQGFTPDMTARPKDTMDAADLTTFDSAVASEYLAKAPVSTSTQK